LQRERSVPQAESSTPAVHSAGVYTVVVTVVAVAVAVVGMGVAVVVAVAAATAAAVTVVAVAVVVVAVAASAVRVVVAAGAGVLVLLAAGCVGNHETFESISTFNLLVTNPSSKAIRADSLLTEKE